MSIIQTDRAIHELRCGRAINIGGTGFLHPEFTDLELIKKLKNPRLVITPSRAHALTGKLPKHNLAICLKANKPEIIHLFIEGRNPGKKISYREDKSKAAEAAVEISRVAQILPCAILFDNPAKSALKATANALLTYQEKLNGSLEEITSAPLNLRDAKKAGIKAFRPKAGSTEHLAIIIGDIGKEPLIRIHSSCYTGDLLGSLSCDCGDQLRETIKLMDKNGGGVILYLMQEGRGIGLINKLRAYKLQSEGLDTVEANEFLGFDDEERAFEPAAVMLKKLGIKKGKLITNNPKKAKALEKNGIKVTGLVPMVIKHEHNQRYLSVKATKSGHLIK